MFVGKATERIRFRHRHGYQRILELSVFAFYVQRCGGRDPMTNRFFLKSTTEKDEARGNKQTQEDSCGNAPETRAIAFGIT